MMLPEELVIEILTRLPAKQLGRSKCVSKPWRSIISCPPFQSAYRSRHGCLMLHWSDEVHFINSGISAGFKRRFNFSYCPLRRLQDSTEDFTLLPKRPVHGFYARATQLVNGLVCIGETEGELLSQVHGLTVYNVCTGEAMRIPEPVQYPGTSSTFHLGYDPASRTYKLLRLIFRVRAGHPPTKLMDYQPRADVMTLRSPGLVSTWRKLECDAACIRDWMKLKCSEAGAGDNPRPTRYVSELQGSEEARTYPGDGVLCWFRRVGGLVLFNLNQEKFRWFKLPEDIKDAKQQLIPWAQFNQEHLSLSLCVVPKAGELYRPQCFVMEDDEGDTWTKHRVEVPEELERGTLGLAVANGEMLLMSPPVVNNHESCSESMAVYCYGRHTNKKVEQFWVGRLHDRRLALGNSRCFGWDACFNNDARLSCLHDANHLYLPLHDVLSGGGIHLEDFPVD